MSKTKTRTTLAVGRRPAGLFVIMALALLLSACVSQPGQARRTPVPSPTDTPIPSERGRGGTLNILYWQAPTMLNPHLTINTKDWEAARIAYEPETVVVYGNSAQVLRLVNAALWEKGGAFKTEFTGRGDCADIVIRTRQSQEPQLILPCYGDRVFGLAGDDEMAFTFPFAQAERFVAGLEGTSKGGIRYPIPTFALRARAEMPATYVELERRWREGGE